MKVNKAVSQAELDAWMPLAIVGRLAEEVPGERERLMAILEASFETGIR